MYQKYLVCSTTTTKSSLFSLAVLTRWKFFTTWLKNKRVDLEDFIHEYSNDFQIIFEQRDSYLILQIIYAEFKVLNDFLAHLGKLKTYIQFNQFDLLEKEIERLKTLMTLSTVKDSKVLPFGYE